MCSSPGGVARDHAGRWLPSDPFGEVNCEGGESEPWELLLFPHTHPPPATGTRLLANLRHRFGCTRAAVSQTPLAVGTEAGAHPPGGHWRQTGNSSLLFGSSLTEHLRVMSHNSSFTGKCKHTVSV